MNTYDFPKEKRRLFVSKLRKDAHRYIIYEWVNLGLALILTIVGLLFFAQDQSEYVKQKLDSKELISTQSDVIDSLISIKLRNHSENNIQLIELLVKEQNHQLLSSQIAFYCYKLSILLITFFLVRIFLNFQVYNTRRASHSKSLADAVEFYDGKGDFEKFVSILRPNIFTKTENFPDSKILNTISSLFGKNGKK